LRRGFLDRIERQYGKGRRIWVMEDGIQGRADLELTRAGGTDSLM
jgi:hypothetical protein